MREDDFWNIIETARREADDVEAIAAAILTALTNQSAEEIVSFDEHQSRLMNASYTTNLWGAAYLINGGCSDDGFDYFRSWLIVQGRQVFESAVSKPDSLANHVEKDEDAECEDVMYAAMTAYESVTGKKLEGQPQQYPELDDLWDFDDATEMRTRYPSLWKTFGW